MIKPFLQAIDERVLVCDGAMGTMLYAKGVFINKSFDALNITQPDLVASVHKEYVRAGAGARRRRRRPLHPRDIPRSERDWRCDRRGPQRVAPDDRRADDHGGGR